jgi:hypothetical protein
MRRTWILGGVLVLVWVVACGGVGAEPRLLAPRNPFGVKDVADPDGKDVQDYAAGRKGLGGADDPNAAEWVKAATDGTRGSIDGQWMDRWRESPDQAWNRGKKGSQIKEIDGRVYLLINASNGQFLVDTKRTGAKGNRLVGRYRGVDNPSDTGPCVFLVVDDERIDGVFGATGRWDFRRKLK